jgi:large subunit ribosomal protein L9
MDVILKREVENLGYKDDLVTVKAGFGRNFLIPTGAAVLATDSAKKVREENMRQKAHREAKERDEALEIGKKITDGSIVVGAKVGEEGKIFGSVNNIQVADAIKALLKVDIDRKKVDIGKEPIKSIGTYPAKVRLHKDVLIEFEFEVAAE